MARGTRSHRRFSSRQLRPTPYPTPLCHWDDQEIECVPKKATALEKRDWEDATCSVCMEYPHNAVLLLCSSHDKGCRPYMCGTSYRHSNCLDQFKKAYTKVVSAHHDLTGNDPTLVLTMSETIELSCPLCRGQVKGWTVVDPAREYLNSKRRSCIQENCSFMGSYKELRKHVRSEHPSAKPREVDPTLEQKWRTLEHERERQDVISTIRSSMPRAVVFGDYVIDMNSDMDTDDEVDRDADFDGGSRGIGRSILYFFLREGARLMRLQREYGTSESREDYEIHPPTSINSADAPAPYSLEGDDIVGADISQPQSMGMGRSERRQRRRRRRSHGRSVSGIS